MIPHGIIILSVIAKPARAGQNMKFAKIPDSWPTHTENARKTQRTSPSPRVTLSGQVFRSIMYATFGAYIVFARHTRCPPNIASMPAARHRAPTS